ncbi:SCO family protein [Methylolobus aquaticus]
MATESTPQRRNRLMLLLIALISLIPFLLAWLYFQNPQWVSGRSNYGNLIVPAQPVAYSDLLRPVGPDAAPLDALKGRWILLQVEGPSGCGIPCQNSLQMTRQIRLLLNKDIVRVRRLLLTAVPNRKPVEGLQEDTDLQYGGLPDELRKKLTAIVGHEPDDGTVILIDPFANVMMWYAPDFDPHGVLRDLKHLLRYSQIG